LARKSKIVNPKSLGFALLLLSKTASLAWGPHPAITQAALDALGTNHPLKALLGEHSLRLTNYCWLADFKRLPFRDVDQDFYADDYLLFPGVPTHLDHICPEVRRSYAPYFKRALQALRTESPANAARWIGSLLHFTEDSGSPPHAAEIRGPSHLKMENWVDATQVRLSNYQPRNLGTNDDSALEGFERRMKELIEFSRPRGQRLMTPVLIGNRKAVEPVSLECALESARVASDLLHTLGHLVVAEKHSGNGFRGRIRSPAVPRFERVPAKVIIHGTSFSTLADAEGGFVFRNLPPGRYEVSALRPGSQATNWVVTIPAEGEVASDVELAKGSLVRNDDFSIRWIKPDGPDCWYAAPQGWEGEVIALQAGRKYRVNVDFRPGSSGEVLMRWSREVAYDLPQNVRLPRIEGKPLRREEPEMTFTASESMALLQFTIRGNRPGDVCQRVRFMVENDAP
jgi:hypothetical protein